MTDIEDERSKFMEWANSLCYIMDASQMAVSMEGWLARARLDGGWMPIESAPVDEVVLTWCGDEHGVIKPVCQVAMAGIHQGLFGGPCEKLWVAFAGQPYYVRAPTHWMPLPSPPKEDGE